MTAQEQKAGCYQLTEVAYQHEAPLTKPTSFEGAVASWRLMVEWLKGQENWQAVEIVENEHKAYATYKLPEGGLYGLWVKPIDDGVLPYPHTLMGDKAWLVRSVPVGSESGMDYTLQSADVTPAPDANDISDIYEGGEYSHQESAGV